MIKREEVEALLAIAEAYSQDDMIAPVRPSRLAELARTWLRVNDAPVVDVYEMSDGRVVTDPPRHLAGQRVRLVPEADSGGEG